jgi:hypothetical protein
MLLAGGALLLPLLALAADPGEDLRQAAMRGDTAAVKALLDAGTPIDAANSYGATALTFACDRGNLEIVKLLLDRGADANLKDQFYGSTAIGWAAYNGHADVVKELLSRGVPGVDDVVGMAIDRGHPAVVQVVIDSGKADKAALGGFLVAAQQAKNAEIVALLEKAGATPPPPAGATIPAEVLQSYLGAYKDPQGMDYKVVLEDGHLRVRGPMPEPFELTPAGEAKFQVVGQGPVTVTFESADGRVSGFSLAFPGGGSHFTRQADAPAPAATGGGR